MEPITRLRTATRLAAPIIACTEPEQYGLSTPCSEWDARTLINHMTMSLTMFRDLARTGAVDPAIFTTDLIGDDPTTAFVTVADEAVAAWEQRGLDGNVTLPFGEFPAVVALQLPAMDMVVHSWDLATATGQDITWNDELVAATHEFVQAAFAAPEMRGNDFGPAVEVPADAAPIDRLVGFLGRRPAVTV